MLPSQMYGLWSWGIICLSSSIWTSALRTHTFIFWNGGGTHAGGLCSPVTLTAHFLVIEVRLRKESVLYIRKKASSRSDNSGHCGFVLGKRAADGLHPFLPPTIHIFLSKVCFPEMKNAAVNTNIDSYIMHWYNIIYDNVMHACAK